ncbi:gustatory receptor for sugar taste 43a isoform X2 [Megachile rotundata]|uniref:gustatory receptor for sugar taste 43a isoform X2 n=1 Tax=Megachile rotundata TaxID=143995 RepID=UPI000615066F|nr:PREDICTED: gustatory receptor for sugar taste 43a-like isoform X2 [Megachile rotundata]
MPSHMRWNIDNDKRKTIGSGGSTNNSVSQNRRRQSTKSKMESKPEGNKDKNTFQSYLCQAISPIYYLGKACGLIPVRFVANVTGGYRARLSILDLFYSLCVLMLLLSAEIWGLWRDLKDGWKHSTRLKFRTAIIATCSDVLGIMSLTVVCIVGSPFRWKKLQVVLNKLIEVDEKIDLSPTKKNARRFTIVLTACSLFFLWFNSTLDFYTWDRKTRVQETMSDKGPLNYASLYFMYTVIIMTEIQYTVSTYNIGLRFVRLNNALLNLSDNFRVTDHFGKSTETVDKVRDKTSADLRSQRQFELTSYQIFRKLPDNSNYVKRISELRLIHSSLCDTVSVINDTFGTVILAVTVTCLLHLIITPYFLIIQAGEKHEWIFLFVQGGWCIFHVARMLMIVQPSYYAVAEGKKTAILVSRLLSSSFETEVRRELEIFSLQLLHRPLEFSACGLFPVDRTLITSIAGVVTTYLVILIQFQNADDTKGDVDIIRNVTKIFQNATQLQNLTGIKIA